VKKAFDQALPVPPVRELVVDDSPAFVAALCDFLGRARARAVVAAADDGQRAVEQSAKHHPGLVIMDVSMPRMSGPEAATEMRRLAPGIRIRMVSIHQDAQTRADSLQHGADSFVSKTGIQRHLLPEIESLFPHLKPGVPTQERTEQRWPRSPEHTGIFRSQYLNQQPVN